MKIPWCFFRVLMIWGVLLLPFPWEVEAQATERGDIRVKEDKDLGLVITVTPWLSDVRPGDFIEWKIRAIGSLDVTFDVLSKHGPHRKLRAAEPPIEPECNRQGALTTNPDVPERIEHYNLKLVITQGGRNSDDHTRS